MLRNVVGWAVQELIAKMKFFDSLIHEFNLGPVLAHFEAPYGLMVLFHENPKVLKSTFFSLRNQNLGRFSLF